MPLSQEQIASLLAQRESKQKPAIPRASQLTNEQAGAFISKLGGMRRSSKGRSYRKPDGYAIYSDHHAVPYYRA